jgi:hypothetical protein
MFLKGVNSFPNEKTKFSLTAALDVDEIVPSVHTSNQNFHLEDLKSLRERYSRVRPELLTDKWMLHHSKAPSYSHLCHIGFYQK